MSKRVFLAAAAASLLPSAWAQQESVRDARMREALRRSQAALKTAEEQAASLTREKADLAAAGAERDAAMKNASVELRSVRGDAARLRTTVAELGSQLQAARASALSEHDAASRREEELSRRLARAETALGERTQTVTSLTGLLERSTESLAKAQAANQRMYAFGRELIEQYRDGMPVDQLRASEPFLGFSAVKLENNAEELRSRLDAARLPSR